MVHREAYQWIRESSTSAWKTFLRMLGQPIPATLPAVVPVQTLHQPDTHLIWMAYLHTIRPVRTLWAMAAHPRGAAWAVRRILSVHPTDPSGETMQISAFKEIANILGCTYYNHLAERVHHVLVPSVPVLVIGDWKDCQDTLQRELDSTHNPFRMYVSSITLGTLPWPFWMMMAIPGTW